MKYRIFFLKDSGVFRYGKRIIHPYFKYEDVEDIPLFFSEETPIKEGLKLMEHNGQVKIVEVGEEEKALDELEGEEKIETEVEEDDSEPEDKEKEGEEEISTIEEVEAEEDEQGYTEDELQEMTDSELADICREEGYSGFSTKDKQGKIELILENQ